MYIVDKAVLQKVCTGTGLHQEGFGTHLSVSPLLNVLALLYSKHGLHSKEGKLSFSCSYFKGRGTAKLLSNVGKEAKVVSGDPSVL
eukprot:1142640-Pelagomonas_calceolata.AAC.10